MTRLLGSPFASRTKMTTSGTKMNLSVMLTTSYLILALAALLLGQITYAQINNLSEQRYAPVKILGFTDPNTNHQYRVVSYNASQMAASSSIRSMIKVTKVKLRDTYDRTPIGEPEFVQTLKYQSTLVDFDLHCVPTHCYLVTVTSKSRQNVELYAWQRVQFDLQATRDSFSRASAVKIFRIQSSFYIAIAQEQLHLSPYKLSQDYEDPVRFIGCSIMKFVKGHEHNVKYHQFIRLSFNPFHVHHFISVNANNATGLTVARPIENHYLVFSVQPNWADTGASQSHSFVWSPLDDYFWPHRMPRGTEVVPRPSGIQLVRFPNDIPQQLNQSQPGPTQDYIGPIETCFHQLQRLLADRDIQARQLLDSSKSIWRKNNDANQYASQHPLTNISAQVVVHGNVIVLGSLIESPQISLIAGRSSPIVDPPSVRQVGHLINSHSPAIVENKFKQAIMKLEYMRQKLSHAVLANLVPNSVSTFNSQMRFFGPIEARDVQMSGIENSNVRLNGISFRQLEHELVSLNGAQDVQTKVQFRGRVVADVLEIHGQINDYYYLRDAIDITSRHVQIIDASGQNYVPNRAGLGSIQFRSISTPEVILTQNATFNAIRLDDFITRDSKLQVVVGHKSFRRLSMGKLDVANPNVLLNHVNIYRLARNAIHLRPVDGKPYQTIAGNAVSFMKNVQVKRLILNNMINRHINMTSLIHDTVKVNDMSWQQIFGQKNFLHGLSIARLTTEGALNGIKVDQIFNLNPSPPVGNPSQQDVPITGEYRINAPVIVRGNMVTGLVNGIDVAKRAVRRFKNRQSPGASIPQVVRGHKTFFKPVRVVNSVRLLDYPEARQIFGNGTMINYPIINNIDLRQISAGLIRQRQQPTPIYVDDLEIDGNLNLPSMTDRNGPPRITLGNYSSCPLDLIRKRLILAGGDQQSIEAPIRVNSLRARSISLDGGTLNGLRIPQDFVLRTPDPYNPQGFETVHGDKIIDQMIISQPSLVPKYGSSPLDASVVLDRAAVINQVDHNTLQAFIRHERQHNSTGEKVYNTITVHGNLHSTRVNGNHWPEDILLKSVSSALGRDSSPNHHKRIYSHLVFLNTSSLQVANQLVLRGPIQLNGRMNGVNLTEFARQSATQGDKDLYSIGRPIRNKIFMGGITVKGEIRAQGLIDGVNFDEMRRRVVTTTPNLGRTVITGPKMFMSDVSFQSPISINYLNDVPMNQYLRRIQIQPDGETVQIMGKKTVTGALRINRNLFVRGLINGVDFAELQARAISLAPSDELAFDKTLTVEGDVFMDNLWIDERNGTIDGVKLINLLPIGTVEKNELILQDPRLNRRADPFGKVLNINGNFLECRVSCNLQAQQLQPTNQTSPLPSRPRQQVIAQQPSVVPSGYPARSLMAYTPRPALVDRPRDYTITRVTPPYSQPPMVSPSMGTNQNQQTQASQQRQLTSLVQRTPIAVNYEQQSLAVRQHKLPTRNITIVTNYIENLRRQIVSIDLMGLTKYGYIVAGFISAPTNDVSIYEPPQEDSHHSEHEINIRSFLVMDQIDFPFGPPLVHHLSVGISTDRFGQNATKVYSSLGGSNITQEISILPIEHPNSAMFLHLPKQGALFLFVSQDYSINTGMCATGSIVSSLSVEVNQPLSYSAPIRRAENGIHVYIFSLLEKSSSLNSLFVDLYQTIDLPGIDSFEKFSYQDSTYVLAISRAAGRVYLLLLRGYSGFQVVSHMDTPMIERITVMFTHDRKPILVIHQTSGLHRIMEPVLI